LQSFTADSFYAQSEGSERVMLLDDADQALFHRVNIIGNARERVLLSTFLFTEGVSSDILVGALLDAADRGVDVSVLVDKWSRIPNDYKQCFIDEPNLRYYEFNPLNLLKPQRINTSMHDKFLIVDDSYLITGGRNIGDEYFIEGTKNFRIDMDILAYSAENEPHGTIDDWTAYYEELINPVNAKKHASKSSRERATTADRERFLECFYAYRETRLSQEPVDYAALTFPVNGVSSVFNSLEIGSKKEPVVAYTLLELAKQSKNIILITPYIALTAHHFTLFADAISGRDVLLFTNSLAATVDVIVYSSYYAHRAKFLQHGVEIYEYQHTEAVLHGKCYLFDDRLTAIGSLNMDERSIRIDTESMLIVDSPELNAKVRESLDIIRTDSIKVDPATNAYAANTLQTPAFVPFGKKALYLVVGHVVELIQYLI
ncbi:MAG: phosphatidylserine/phosphatidylglycerophosphate/cardiolipin synthase family protein, partial [Clostridia bacterium]|nr:phosphatidylserine/phosphatidylglycerophosphate/cardiolipin synthase family protein [Clostridia bacterium]